MRSQTQVPSNLMIVTSLYCKYEKWFKSGWIS